MSVSAFMTSAFLGFSAPQRFSNLRLNTILKNKDKYDGTALVVASINGHATVVKVLLGSGGADVNKQDGDGNTALMGASAEGHYEIINILISKNANPNLKAKDGWTALMHAVEEGHHDVARKLIAINADVDAVDNDNSTALMYATANKDLDAVKILIGNNAKLNIQNIDGCTALIFASRAGYVEIIKVLLEFCADSSIVDGDGKTAYEHADDDSQELIRNARNNPKTPPPRWILIQFLPDLPATSTTNNTTPSLPSTFPIPFPISIDDINDISNPESLDIEDIPLSLIPPYHSALNPSIDNDDEVDDNNSSALEPYKRVSFCAKIDDRDDDREDDIDIPSQFEENTIPEKFMKVSSRIKIFEPEKEKENDSSESNPESVIDTEIPSTMSKQLAKVKAHEDKITRFRQELEKDSAPKNKIPFQEIKTEIETPFLNIQTPHVSYVKTAESLQKIQSFEDKLEQLKLSPPRKELENKIQGKVKIAMDARKKSIEDFKRRQEEIFSSIMLKQQNSTSTSNIALPVGSVLDDCVDISKLIDERRSKVIIARESFANISMNSDRSSSIINRIFSPNNNTHNNAINNNNVQTVLPPNVDDNNSTTSSETQAANTTTSDSKEIIILLSDDHSNEQLSPTSPEDKEAEEKKEKLMEQVGENVVLEISNDITYIGSQSNTNTKKNSRIDSLKEELKSNMKSDATFKSETDSPPIAKYPEDFPYKSNVGVDSPILRTVTTDDGLSNVGDGGGGAGGGGRSIVPRNRAKELRQISEMSNKVKEEIMYIRRRNIENELRQQRDALAVFKNM